MKSFLYRWFWEGRNSSLLFCAGAFSILWCGLYIHAARNIFLNGFLIPSIAIAALLLLPFSVATFRVWVIFSLIFLPIIFLDLATQDPRRNTDLISDIAINMMWGIFYFAVTILIIILVPLVQWVYKKLKRK